MESLLAPSGQLGGTLHGHPERVGRLALANLGNCRRELGELDDALTLADRGIALVAGDGDLWGEAYFTYHRGSRSIAWAEPGRRS